MDWKNLTAKSLSLLLITAGLYQVIPSLKAILFIYPHLGPEATSVSLLEQEGLIERALVLYATMFINGTYGAILLFKPSREIKVVHLLAGILIAVASIFFVTQTSLTTDPVIDFFLRLTH